MLRHSTTTPTTTKVETNKMDVIISDGSGTVTHEDLMFSPLVTTFSKLYQVSPSFIAKENSDEEGTVVVTGGPVVRNMMIMTKITNLTEEEKNFSSDKEKKLLKNIVDMMLKEFATVVSDEIDGIAMFFLSIGRLTKGTAYGLIIFHKGSTLLLETLSKKQVRHSWEEPLEKSERLKIKDMAKQELRLLGLMKLKTILGHDNMISSRFSTTYFIPQDPDVFSHFGDEKHQEYCWQCHVTIRKLKKATCAGCLVARYCTLGCQEKDRSRHRDYCMKKKARREERKLSKVRPKVIIDWDKEVD